MIQILCHDETNGWQKPTIITDNDGGHMGLAMEYVVAFKKQFYDKYVEMYRKNRDDGCPLITQDVYLEYIESLWSTR